MPLILEPGTERIYKQGEGWKMTMLAGYAEVGSSALVVRCWSLQAGAHIPVSFQEGNEEMLYVMHGSGQAVIGDQIFELGTESLLWLEPGDTYQLIAGDAGLEILQGYAPL